jgi:EmrB/QacA subfamily drug resistance transporter
VILATVMGSGIAFLDGTVVNVALPAIAEDFGVGMSSLQWTLDAYLLTLGSLLLLGGSLGDRYGRRRMFVTGLIAFTGASLLCGVAPNAGALIVARAVQGVGGALLVPGSLALLSASFHHDDRGKAVGAWSGLAGVATAIGPFLGGWLIDAVSWRLVFLINVPIAAATVLVTMRHVPESRDEDDLGHLDLAGAVSASLGLGGVVYALIEGPAQGVTPAIAAIGVLGVLCLVAFPFIESRVPHPMVPLSLFRSRQFSGANLTTFAVYGGLGTATFLLVIYLQTQLDYSALEAGASLLPITVLMLSFSSRAGDLAQRIGPRWPMTIGPLIVAVAALLLSRIEPGSSYVTEVLPGIIVLGIGLVLTVAPLTTAVMASVDEHHLGTGSGINNAVARVAGLLAVAVLPGVVGIASDNVTAAEFTDGFQQAMFITAGLSALGGLLSWLTIRDSTPVQNFPLADANHPCASIDCIEQDAAAG